MAMPSPGNAYPAVDVCLSQGPPEVKTERDRSMMHNATQLASERPSSGDATKAKYRPHLPKDACAPAGTA
jgi:hypothetical protein